jgi:hypothetical protein
MKHQPPPKLAGAVLVASEQERMKYAKNAKAYLAALAAAAMSAG